ncbi:NAD-dependent epimerase/dehydratase family protein [Blastococcus brunescens]|uniref:NAD-dependent epimerase/dehydratase family protein n=1 Tax=Blastococcus brunescens TaxID=1564165 RepID=A0ABZ1AXT8_9ACTN|nr:NAD-dependent epimerase/dehydratase family protein [Blastococcus sp. BMG 8361]WRL62942.1 NAD-dependent epimerase/dehydratase family protein [Blastococcus sp. BMG 8361]
MADCLVIGGNGFIGSHVVDSLVDRGHSVTVFDRHRPGPPRFTDPSVRVVHGDFLNAADVRNAVRDQEVVLHLLSTTDPATAEGDPTIDIRTNITSSVQLFQVCAEAGVARVYYASSGGAIYGDQDQQVFRETDVTLPVSPYAIGKQAIESYLRYFSRTSALESTTFRISNPYGPRQNPLKRQGVIPIFLRRVADGQPLTVFGDGSMIRDYLYVADLAEMIAEVVTAGARESLYNVGSGVGTSISELVRTIEEVTGRDVQVENRPRPATFVDHVVLSVERFEKEFATRATTSLPDGIRRTWEEITSNG